MGGRRAGSGADVAERAAGREARRRLRPEPVAFRPGAAAGGGDGPGTGVLGGLPAGVTVLNPEALERRAQEEAARHGQQEEHHAATARRKRRALAGPDGEAAGPSGRSLYREAALQLQQALAARRSLRTS